MENTKEKKQKDENTTQRRITKIALILIIILLLLLLVSCSLYEEIKDGNFGKKDETEQTEEGVNKNNNDKNNPVDENNSTGEDSQNASDGTDLNNGSQDYSDTQDIAKKTQNRIDKAVEQREEEITEIESSETPKNLKENEIETPGTIPIDPENPTDPEEPEKEKISGIVLLLTKNGQNSGMYADLQSAITAANEEPSYIYLLDNCPEKVITNRNQTILLNLNGKTISSTEITLVNRGTLEVIDYNNPELDQVIEILNGEDEEKKVSLLNSYNQCIDIPEIIENGNGTIATNPTKEELGIGIYNTGNLTIKNGKVTATVENTSEVGYGIYNYEKVANVEILGGEINVSGAREITGIYNYYTIDGLEIKGGKITANGINAKGIANYNSVAEINNCNIITNGTEKSYGITNSEGELRILGGTIEAKGQEASGVYNINDSKLIIGEKIVPGVIENEIPNIENPNIYGDMYGINNENGRFNFYDGILRGKAKGIKGDITRIEAKNQLLRTRETEIETVILTNVSTQKTSESVAYIIEDGIEYYYTTLESAIASINEKQPNTTITMINNTEEEVIISKDKEITLDLNTFTVTSTGLTIENRGKLQVIDTVGGGKITTTGDYAGVIKNLGELDITRVTIEAQVQNDGYGIYNYGRESILNFNRGQIKSNGITGIAINNEGGTVNQYEGTISVSGNSAKGINNNQGTVNIIEGNITSSGENGFAIYNASGIVNLGTADGVASLAIPAIYAEGIAIFNYDETATLNFYDGVIRAKNTWKNEKGILNVENAYVEFVEREDSGYEKATLAYYVAEIGEKHFARFKDAVAAVPTTGEQTTIRMVRNVSLNYDETQSISNDKNIILDLNGKTISGAEKVISNNGTLVIKDTAIGGTLQTNSYYGASVLSNSGNLTIDGIKIKAVGSLSGTGITNSNNLTFKSGEILVTSAQNGYGISNSGTVTMEHGSIDVSNSEVGYGISGSGNVVLGIEDEELNIEEPSIVATTEAIRCGTLDFYNGVVKGKQKAINGYLRFVKEMHEVKETIGEYDVVVLQTRDTELTENTVAIIEEEGQTQYFRNIKNAITYIQKDLEESVTIKLVKNTQEYVEIPAAKNIVIDINGKTISSDYETVKTEKTVESNFYTITNNGTLEITDSEGTGRIRPTTEKYAIKNNSIFTLANGIINGEICNNETAIIDGGKVYGFNNGIQNNKSLFVNGGEIYGEEFGVNNNTISNLSFNAGQISGKTDWRNYVGILTVPDGYEVKVVSENEFENATIILSDTEQTEQSVAKITRNNVTKYYRSLEGAINSVANDTSATIVMLKDTNETVSIMNTQNITIDLNGKTITSNKITITNYSILNIIDAVGTGKVETTANVENTSIAIKNLGTLNVKSGTVVASGANYGYAISSNSGVADTIIGTIGQVPSTTIPNIIGTEYGIYKQSGITRFYDGKISGKTDSNYQYIDVLEQGYDLERTTNGEYKVITLQLPSKIYTANSVATIIRGGENYYYNTLTGAINSVTEGEGNVLITMLKNTNDTSFISEEKSITLDLAGYTITSGSTAISNNGNLTLKDSVGTGIISGEIYGISNTAIFDFEAGVIKGKIKAINGKVTTVKEGHEIIITNEEEYKVATLSLMETELTSNSVAKISREGVNYYYKSLYGAINSVAFDEENVITITMLKNTDESVEIYNGQNISIDLNGNVISNAETTITNKGILSLTNISENGMIISDTKAIHNSKILKLDGATIRLEEDCSGTAIYNEENLTINSGRIEVNTENSTGIYNVKDLIINDGVIKTTGNNNTGIYNNDGTVTILGGSIEATGEGSIGIRNNGNEGTVTIGNTAMMLGRINRSIMGVSELALKGRNIVEGGGELEPVEESTIKVLGQTYGISCSENSVLKFFDGEIYGGEEWKNETGKINIKEGYEVEVTTTPEYRIATLGQKETELTENTVAVLTQNGITYYYKSLIGAIIDVNSNSTASIKMVKNTEEYVTIVQNQNILLDLNGCTITSNNNTITTKGTLRIQDNTEEKLGKIETTSNIEGKCSAIRNEGNLAIEGGNIEANGAERGNGIQMISGSTVRIGQNDGEVSVEKPIIKGTTFGICKNGGSLEFFDGIIKGKLLATNVEEAFDRIPNLYEIFGETKNGFSQITLKKYIAQIDETRYESLEEAIEAVEANNENVVITMINSTNESVEIAENKNITIDLNGKTINSEEITITNNGKLEIIGTGTIVTSSNTEETAKAIVNSSELLVKSGTIMATGENFGIGIYNNSNVTIGTQGGSLSKTEPVIKGSDCGIYNNEGTVDFFDGKIMGRTNAINTEFTTIEEKCELKVETIDGFEVVRLMRYVAQIDEEKYESLQEAINEVAINGEQKTIIILENISESSIIQSGKRVVIDLKGKTIYSNSTAITNYGTLEIIDTAEGGKVESLTGYAISNVGNLKVKQGTIQSGYVAILNYATVEIGTLDEEVSTVAPEIIGENYGIVNVNGTGIIKFYDGVIKARTECVSGKITELVTGYELNEQISNEYKNITLIEMDTELTSNTVASITKDGQTKYYRSIKNALRTINDSTTTVKIEKNVNEKIDIERYFSVIIDLNGKTVSSEGTVLNNRGTVTLIDTAENGVIQSTNGGTTVENSGTISLSDASIKSEQEGGIGFRNNYIGRLNFNSGKIIGKAKAITGTGSINTPTGYMVDLTSENECEVAELAVYVATIENITYVSLQDAIDAVQITNSSDVRFTTINMVLDVEETVTIPEGKQINLNLNGKTVTSEGTTITNNGKLVVTGNGVVSTTREDTNAIINNNELSINNSSIVSENGSAIENNSILNAGVSMSTEIPEIKGAVYGVDNEENSVLNFNGGAIKGKTNWSNEKGEINTRKDYEVEVKEVETYKVATLYLPFIDKPEDAVAAIRRNEESNYYTTLAAAIQSVGTVEEEATTIVMLKDREEVVTIAEGQKIVIDLAGKIISSEGTTITNNGALCLIDETSEGAIKGKTGALAGTNDVTVQVEHELVKYNLEDYKFVKVVKSMKDEESEPGEEGESSIIVAVIPTLDGIETFKSLKAAVESIKNGDLESKTIILLVDTEEQITVNNGQKVKIDLSGKTISSEGTTITNNGELKIVDSNLDGKITTTSEESEITASIENNSILTITEGKIENGIINSGAITIGKEGGVPSNTVPEIIGEVYGIFNTNELCKIELYDGIVKGKTSWYNEIGELATQAGCDLVVDIQGEYEIAYLNTGVARIGNIYYTSIQSAIDAVELLAEEEEPTRENATTIIMREDREEKVVVPSGKNIILDLAGKTVSSTGTTITNEGILTIIDSSTNGKIGTVGNPEDEDLVKAIVNKGHLNVENVNVEAEYAIAIQNEGTEEKVAKLSIGVEGEGVSEVFPEIKGVYGIYEENENSIITIYDGKITGTIESIYGTVETTEFGYYLKTADKISILKMLDTNRTDNSVAKITYGEGTYYTDTLEAAIMTAPLNKEEAAGITALVNIEENARIIEEKNIILDLNEKTITSETIVIKNQGKLEIVDNSESKTGKIENTGDIVTTARGIENKGELIITSGNIITRGVGFGYAVLNDAENATVQVKDGTIKSEGTNGRAISNNRGNVEVIDGKIIAEGSAAYGIYSLGNEDREDTSIVIIGTEGGEVSKTIPEITGGAYGIYNEYSKVSIRFYDGVIKGKNAWKNNAGSLTLEKQCDVQTEVIDSYQVATLDKFVALIGTAKFETLQDAIDVVPKNAIPMTITMVRSVDEQVETYLGQKILLQLAGNTVSSEGVTIINNGTLEIQNSQTTGGIETTGNTEETGIAIQNNKTLTLTSADVSALGVDYGYGISNGEEGIINFNGGKVSGKTDWKIGEGTITPKTNYKIEVSEVDDYKVAEIVEWYVAKIGTTRYKTLALAINAVPTDKTETTIVMYEDTNESVTIANTKNIVLDLNGKVISSTGNTITNQGTLKVLDSSEEQIGKVETTGNNYDAIYNQTTNTSKQITFVLKGGIILSLNERGRGIHNCTNDSNSVVNCMIEGGEIKAFTYGIYNQITNTSQIIDCTITGGEVEGSIYGIHNRSYSSSTINLTVGTKGGELGTTSPLIIGNTAGIYQHNYDATAKIYYYDGKIKSISGEPITQDTMYPGTVVVEENCQMIEYIEDGYRTNILVEIAEDKVALIPTETSIELYDSIQAAIDDVEELEVGVEPTADNETAIILLKDTQEMVTVPENKNIKLYLNNKIVTSEGTTITNNGALTIVDDNTIGKVETTANTENATAIQNNGTLQVEGGTILASGEDYGKAITSEGENAKVTIGSETTFTYANPTIKGTEYGLFVEDEGEYNFYAGRIYGKINATNVEETVSKEGYTVTKFMEVGCEGKVLLENNNTYIVAVITDTTFVPYTKLSDAMNKVPADKTETKMVMLKNTTETSSTNIQKDKNVILELNGCKMNYTSSSSHAIYNNSTLKVIDSSKEKTGEIKNSATNTTTAVIYTHFYSGSSSEESFTLESGTLISINAYGIYNLCSDTNGIVNCVINGGIVKGKQAIYNYCNYVNAISSCTITGGIIEGSQYGIYNQSSQTTSQAIVSIGTKGEGVSATEPVIIGGTNGVYQYNRYTGGTYTAKAELNFYDGKIQSITGEVIQEHETYPGTVNLEDNCQIVEYLENGYKTDILVSEETMQGKVAAIPTSAGVQLYDSVQAAINDVNELDEGVEATEENETIVILLSDSNETVTVPENKNINVYLNDKTITSDGITVTNNGTLRITNSSTIGKVETTADTENAIAIQNNGTLKVEGGSILANGETYGKAISNSGESAKVTIGSETMFSYANPTIKGSEYGLFVAGEGEYNFYAGRIYGKTNATNVDETSVKATYEARKFMEVGYEGKILLPKGNITYVAAVSTQTTFSVQTTLANAITNAPVDKTEATVIMLQGVSQYVTIPSTKNIVLELNGKIITSTSHTISNQGKLRVIDSSKEKTGSIISTNYYAILNDGGNASYNTDFTLESGTISSTTNSAIYNSSISITLNCNINGGSVKGKNAIYNNSYDKSINCTVTGGILEGTVEGIRNICNRDTSKITLTIGTQGEEISTTIPVIIGKTNAIYNIRNNVNELIINYYDGKIKSLESATIYDSNQQSTLNIEDGCQIIELMEVGYKTNILVPVETMVGKVAIVVRTSGITAYETLQGAIDSVELLDDSVEATTENATTVILLEDIEEIITVPENKNINLSLSNKVLTSNGITITNNGTLSISDIDAIGKVMTTANTEGATAVKNNGTLKVDGGSIFANGETYGKAITNVGENATVTIGNEEMYSTCNPTIKGTEYGLFVEGEGEYNFYAGRIYGKTNATNVDETAIKEGYEARKFIEVGYEGKVLLPQGNTTYVSALATETTFTLQTSITAGTGTLIILQNVNTNSMMPILPNYNTVLELNGKTINSTTTVIENRGKLKVIDSSIEKNGMLTTSKVGASAIFNSMNNASYNPELTVESGIIRSENYYGIYNYSTIGKTLNCNIYGGTIIGTHGIENYSNNTNDIINCTITGGNIEGKTYGIYSRSVLGTAQVTVTLGEIGGDVNTTAPVIIGDTNGIYNYIDNNTAMVKINYYDGKIKSLNDKVIFDASKNLSILNIEPNYQIVELNEDGYRIDALVLTESMEGKVAAVLLKGKVEAYDTLQATIDAVEVLENGEEATATNITSIALLVDVEETVIIPENKNINLYLDNHVLTSAGTTITNNGSLKITASSAVGKVETTGNTEGTRTIVNIGNLKLEGGTISASAESCGKTIENEGTLEIFKDSVVETIANIENAIAINNTGILRVEGGKVLASGETYGKAITNIGESANSTIGSETVFSYNNPTIRGTENGVYVESGTYNFYAGTIYGKINATNIVETASKEGYIVKTFMELGYERKVLLDSDNYVAVSSTETTFTPYGTLALAITGTTTGNIIMLKDSINIAQTVPNGKNITLELNGKTISGSSNTITNKGTLKVVDSSKEKTGIISATASAIYNNNSNYHISFTLESGTVQGNIRGIHNYNCNSNSNDIICTINGGKVIGGIGIFNENYNGNRGDLNGQKIHCYINGGEIEGISTYGIYNYARSYYGAYRSGYIDTYVGKNDGDIKTVSPIITGKTNGIMQDVFTTNECTTYFYDGKVRSLSGEPIKQNAAYPERLVLEENTQLAEFSEAGYRANILVLKEDSEGKVAIIPGKNTYNSLQAAINDVQELSEGMEPAQENATSILLLKNISESVIIPANKSITLSLNGNILISEGTTITNQGNLQITDNSIKGKVETTSNVAGATAIHNTGTLKIEGGSIVANGEIYGTAISNSGENAKVTIGSELTFSYANPTIKGTEYGLFVEGEREYNFYAGRIYGKINATNVDETSVKETYETRKFMEVGYEGKVLLLKGDTTYKSAVSTETTFTVYTTLGTAITAVPTDNIETAVVMLQNVTENSTIASDKNVVLELNGKIISSTVHTITNNGTLSVVDSSKNQDGIIETTGSSEFASISNGSVFELRSGTLEGRLGIQNYMSNSGKTIDCTVSGGEILGSTAGIHNRTGGSSNTINCTISGGKVAGNTYGIHNLGNIAQRINCRIIGGEITGEQYGIYSSISSTNNNYASSNITVTVGEKGGTLGSITPIITGNTEGIYQQKKNGTVHTNFYDGKIRSINGEPITQDVTYPGTISLEDNCQIVEFLENGYKTDVLMSEETMQGKVAAIPTSAGVQLYDSVQASINDVNELDEGYKVAQLALPVVDPTLASQVEIGDYVNYNLTASTGYELNSAYTGETTKTVTREDLKWRVLDKNSETGEVTLIADTPTTQTVALKGALGYNNAVYLLNDMCDKLYSKSGVGTARSIKIEDIEERSTFNTRSYDGYGRRLTPSYKYCPVIYQYEKSGLNRSDDGSTKMTMSTTQGGLANGITSAVSSDFYLGFNSSNMKTPMFSELLVIKDGTQKKYWIASRCVDVSSDSVVFFAIHTMGSASYLYSCGNDSGSYNYGVVPIVSITPNIKTTGKNESGAWEINEEGIVQNNVSAIYRPTVGASYETDVTGIGEKTWNTVGKSVNEMLGSLVAPIKDEKLDITNVIPESLKVEETEDNKAETTELVTEEIEGNKPKIDDSEIEELDDKKQETNESETEELDEDKSDNNTPKTDELDDNKGDANEPVIDETGENKQNDNELPTEELEGKEPEPGETVTEKLDSEKSNSEITEQDDINSSTESKNSVLEGNIASIVRPEIEKYVYRARQNKVNTLFSDIRLEIENNVRPGAIRKLALVYRRDLIK